MKTGDERRRGRAMSRDDAEGIAIAALAFLASDATRLERFLALSGLTPDSLRRAAAAPGFLAAVIEYVTNDEALLVDFAAADDRDPTAVARAGELLASTSRRPWSEQCQD